MDAKHTSLHTAVMNLPVVYPPDFENGFERDCYLAGHHDARHAAAELALRADDLLAALRDSQSMLAIAITDAAQNKDAQFARLCQRQFEDNSAAIERATS